MCVETCACLSLGVWMRTLCLSLGLFILSLESRHVTPKSARGQQNERRGCGKAEGDVEVISVRWGRGHRE